MFYIRRKDPWSYRDWTLDLKSDRSCLRCKNFPATGESSSRIASPSENHSRLGVDRSLILETIADATRDKYTRIYICVAINIWKPGGYIIICRRGANSHANCRRNTHIYIFINIYIYVCTSHRLINPRRARDRSLASRITGGILVL